MYAIQNDKGQILIVCDEQVVLEISEISDEDTINLFLIPAKNTDIIKTEDLIKQQEFPPKEVSKSPWTHEVLAMRNALSKRVFEITQPLYSLPGDDRKKGTKK